MEDSPGSRLHRVSTKAAIVSGFVTAGLVLAVVWAFEISLSRAALLAPPERFPADLRPEHDEARNGAGDHDQHRRQHGGSLELDVEEPDHQQHEPCDDETGDK